MAILLDMTGSHVPVLAGELIDLTAPAPGELVVDCTFGAGGHARLLAERIGPAGTLIAMDRDPAAEERFDEFADEVACDTRFLRMDFVDGLRLLHEQGIKADLVMFDLGISSMQVDARERGFSYAYDAPLDMRMDPSEGPDAREIVNELDESTLVQVLRRYGEEPHARQIAREIVREGARSRRRASSWTRSRPRSRRRCAGASAAATPPSGRSRRSGSWSTTSSTTSTRPCPRPGTCSRSGGRLAAISFHSLEDRRVKRFLTGLAQGCVCPPDFPVCICGRTPDAELLNLRAVMPTPGELADNPRSRSGRLRVARKLAESG